MILFNYRRYVGMSTLISRRRDPTIQKILNVTALGFTKDAATSKNFRDWIKYWSTKFRYFLLSTSSTQPIAAIILGKPVVVNDSVNQRLFFSLPMAEGEAWYRRKKGKQQDTHKRWMSHVWNSLFINRRENFVSELLLSPKLPNVAALRQLSMLYTSS